MFLIEQRTDGLRGDIDNKLAALKHQSINQSIN